MIYVLRVYEQMLSINGRQTTKDEERELKEQMESADEEIERLKKHRANLAESHRAVKEKTSERS